MAFSVMPRLWMSFSVEFANSFTSALSTISSCTRQNASSLPRVFVGVAGLFRQTELDWIPVASTAFVTWNRQKLVLTCNSSSAPCNGCAVVFLNFRLSFVPFLSSSRRSIAMLVSVRNAPSLVYNCRNSTGLRQKKTPSSNATGCGASGHSRSS